MQLKNHGGWVVLEDSKGMRAILKENGKSRKLKAEEAGGLCHTETRHSTRDGVEDEVHSWNDLNGNCP
jgi:hypothetical protein